MNTQSQIPSAQPGRGKHTRTNPLSKQKKAVGRQGWIESLPAARHSEAPNTIGEPGLFSPNRNRNRNRPQFATSIRDSEGQKSGHHFGGGVGNAHRTSHSGQPDSGGTGSSNAPVRRFRLCFATPWPCASSLQSRSRITSHVGPAQSSGSGSGSHTHLKKFMRLLSVHWSSFPQ